MQHIRIQHLNRTDNFGLFQNESEEDQKEESKFQVLKELLKNENVALIISMYCCLLMGSSFVSNIYPIWSMTSKSDGGLSFSTAEIGSMQCIAGIFGLVYQGLIYHRMAAPLGSLGVCFLLVCWQSNLSIVMISSR
jgi:hypothetical protein